MHSKYIARAAEISPAILPLNDKFFNLSHDFILLESIESAIYLQYYRYQFELRGVIKNKKNELSSNKIILPIVWSSLIDLWDISQSQESNGVVEVESWGFYYKLIRYLMLVPVYRYKKISIYLTLKSLKIPKNILITYSAIQQSTDVFNNFLLDVSAVKQIYMDFTPTDLCALYIQLADEFIDNVKEEIDTRHCIDLIKSHWLDVFGGDGEMPFPKGIESLFEEKNINLKTVYTKYNISCYELLNVIHVLSDEIFRRVKRFDKSTADNFIEKFRLSVEQAFGTFLEELYISISEEPHNCVDHDLLEHYERKTTSVLAAWLELRAINAKVPLQSKAVEIRNWSRLFLDFQIFDDLKDIHQDFDKQPNLLQIISYLYPDEAKWLNTNVTSLTLDGDLHGTIKINLHMPKTIMHLKMFSNVNGNYHFSPFLKAVQNYRWKKSWLSPYLSFQQKNTSLHLDEIIVENYYNSTMENPLQSAVLKVLISTSSLYDYTKSMCIYFAHCLDVLGYDDRGYIYRFSSLKNIWRHFVFSPTMSITNKHDMFIEILKKSKSITSIIDGLNNFSSNSALQKTAEYLKNHE